MPPCRPRLASGVAPVTFGLSSSLVFYHARDAVFISFIARFLLGSRRSIGYCLAFGGLGVNALLLFQFYTFSLRAPFFPGFGYSLTLRLPCKPRRFRGLLRGAII
jgi:hypothetical protein